jgi:hypothetical protein
MRKIFFEGNKLGKISLPVLEKDCCPNYLYSCIPKANSQHEVGKFLFEFIYYKNILYFPSIIIGANFFDFNSELMKNLDKLSDSLLKIFWAKNCWNK